MILSDEAIRLWEAAKAINREAARVSPAAGSLPPLIFVTDPGRTPRPWEIAARLPAGAAVIHRGFGRPEAAEEAARLREATRKSGVRLLIGLDLDLAVRIAADGLHLPEGAWAQAQAARGAVSLVTIAAHSKDALHRAEEAGVDAAILSPVFPTTSPSGGEPMGAATFGRLVADSRKPVYALGGVTAANAARLVGSGACGLCAVDGVQRSFSGGED